MPLVVESSELVTGGVQPTSKNYIYSSIHPEVGELWRMPRCESVAEALLDGRTARGRSALADRCRPCGDTEARGLDRHLARYQPASTPERTPGRGRGAGFGPAGDDPSCPGCVRGIVGQGDLQAAKVGDRRGCCGRHRRRRRLLGEHGLVGWRREHGMLVSGGSDTPPMRPEPPAAFRPTWSWPHLSEISESHAVSSGPGASMPGAGSRRTSPVRRAIVARGRIGP